MRAALSALSSALMLLALAGPAQAADAVTDAMQAAYAPYRVALFRTNGKAQPESVQAVAQAQQAWADVVRRFGAQPPAPYDRDPGFAATLAQVTAVYEHAAAQVGAQQLAQAHDTLEAARGLLADLRRRNQVVVYSDHMNAFHAEMEHLLAQAPQRLAEPQAPLHLMAPAGVLDYLAARLASEAPAALREQAEFAPLLDAVRASVAALKGALLAGDNAAVRDALGKLKPAYGKLFLKFG